MYFSFILRLFFSPLTHLLFICLFRVFFVFFYLFFFILFPFIGFPITSQNAKQNEKSKIQTPKSRSKSVEACLPNTCLPNKCVCPPVCPTASSPKAQTFEPPPTIHFVKKIGLFAPYFFHFFPVIKAAVFYMEFWFMTGLPQESRQFFVFANSSAQWAKCHAGNHQKKCKVWLINVLFPKNLEQQKKMDGKNFARVPPRGPLPLW